MPSRFTDWLGSQRNRFLGRPGFRSWASRFPLTRPIARHEAARLFDLVAGFVYSQVLLAFVQLRLVEALQTAPLHEDELRAHCQLPPKGMQRLLAAACTLELLHLRQDGRYQLGSLGAALQDNTAVESMVLHHSVLYGDLADPVALLRGEMQTTALSRFWAYADDRIPQHANADAVRNYTALMAASQPLVAEHILGACPLRKYRCLMDIGGGNGTFLTAVAHAAPHLTLKLFDLPAVVEQARHNLAGTPVAGRIEFIPGSFHTDPIPSGADVISLVRVLHDHDDAPALSLLEHIHKALPRGGALILAEPMADAPGGERMGSVYFGFYLLAMKSGRSRSVKENKDLLIRAGFSDVQLRPTPVPLQAQILIAEK